MDQVTLTKNQLKFQHWSNLIAQYQESGMTLTAWCEQNNICKKSYYYWLRKIRLDAIENSPVPVNKIPENKPEDNISFKKLEVQSPVSGMQAAVVVHLPMATVEVAQGTDRQTVEAVLLALKSVC